jgi:hypothetical protein
VKLTPIELKTLRNWDWLQFGHTVRELSVKAWYWSNAKSQLAQR